MRVAFPCTSMDAIANYWLHFRITKMRCQTSQQIVGTVCLLSDAGPTHISGRHVQRGCSCAFIGHICPCLWRGTYPHLHESQEPEYDALSLVDSCVLSLCLVTHSVSFSTNHNLWSLKPSCTVKVAISNRDWYGAGDSSSGLLKTWACDWRRHDLVGQDSHGHMLAYFLPCRQGNCDFVVINLVGNLNVYIDDF